MQRFIEEKAILNDLIDYQDGAVVSKEIIRKDGGTITLFSFDREQGLSEHTAPFDAFVYLVEGKAAIKIAGVAHILTKDEAIVMPANKPHSLKAVERFKMLLVMIKK